MRVVPDPIRGAPHLLIMCEVLSPNGEPHATNTRAQLAALIDEKVRERGCWEVGGDGGAGFVGGGGWQANTELGVGCVHA